MKNRILVVGDIHEPVSHPGYLDFCTDIATKYDCNRTLLIGDVVDWNSINDYQKLPEAPSPADEYQLALQGIQRWYARFPKAVVTIGNHDERVVRIAEGTGIPAFLLKNYSEVWQTPGWEWVFDTVIDDVYYFHGTGQGGLHPAHNAMRAMLMSVVMGHIHSVAGVRWAANPNRRIFGMDVGCGVDDKTIAFHYGRHNKRRSILSAGVVLDGVPYHEIMPMGPGERYHRSRFEKRRKK